MLRVLVYPRSSKDGLGLTYAFLRYKARCVLVGRGVRGWRGDAAVADLKALQSLWKTRTQQLELLKSQLLSASSHSRVSHVIPQTLMPAPKPAVSAEQLKLQNQLIAACKQGDEKAVTALLKQGAKPGMSNAGGEHPLGAAVWGICPDVVNVLLAQSGIDSMTWERM